MTDEETAEELKRLRIEHEGLSEEIAAMKDESGKQRLTERLRQIEREMYSLDPSDKPDTTTAV
jgi:hypothetical protein